MSDETKKTIEAWAIEKGYSTSVRVVDPSGRKPASIVATPDWRFAALKALQRWPTGLEVTEFEFDEAAQRALNIAVQ
jgi:hypothetical protein